MDIKTKQREEWIKTHCTRVWKIRINKSDADDLSICVEIHVAAISYKDALNLAKDWLKTVGEEDEEITKVELVDQICVH